MVEGADFLETNSSSSSPWPTDMDMEFVVVECVIFGGGGGGEKGGFPFPRWGKDDDMFLLLLLPQQKWILYRDLLKIRVEIKKLSLLRRRRNHTREREAKERTFT